MKETDVVENKQKMTINPQGAKITSLILDGREQLFSGKRGDGKDGMTHPCMPFGPDLSGRNIPQHGPLRNARWEVKEETPSRTVLSYEIDHENYPKGMIVTQEFDLGEHEFSLTTIHHNTGNDAAPVNFGEHFYWSAPNGWEGVTVNGQDVTELVKADQAIALQPSNVIRIPGQPPIRLVQKGFSKAMLWTYKNQETGVFDTSYVCIEPIERSSEAFGKPESMVQPGEKRITQLHISVM